MLERVAVELYSEVEAQLEDWFSVVEQKLESGVEEKVGSARSKASFDYNALILTDYKLIDKINFVTLVLNFQRRISLSWHQQASFNKKEKREFAKQIVYKMNLAGDNLVVDLVFSSSGVIKQIC